MDSYDRKARLYPAVSILAPITLFAAVLFVWSQWLPGFLGLLAAGGLHVLVIQVVRDRGTRIQPRLWESWGGTPTTVKLRWGSAKNGLLHRRRHTDVAAATGISLPSAEEETVNPADADAAYEAAASLLREMTRNESEHPRLRAELANYGYRRNLYACRPYGITVGILVLITEVVLAALGYRQNLEMPTTLLLAAASGTLIWLAILVFVVTPDFVRRNADRYADALISAASSFRA